MATFDPASVQHDNHQAGIQTSVLRRRADLFNFQRMGCKSTMQNKTTNTKQTSSFVPYKSEIPHLPNKIITRQYGSLKKNYVSEMQEYIVMLTAELLNVTNYLKQDKSTSLTLLNYIIRNNLTKCRPNNATYPHLN
jgi:hypothetical protein